MLLGTRHSTALKSVSRRKKEEEVFRGVGLSDSLGPTGLFTSAALLSSASSERRAWRSAWDDLAFRGIRRVSAFSGTRFRLFFWTLST